MRNAQYLFGLIVLVGVCGAVAALWGPSEPLAGVDFGATGASVFVLALAGAIWLFATHADDLFAEHMSISERRAWIGLVFVAVILALFLHHIWTLSGRADVPGYLNGFLSKHFIPKLFTLLIAWGVISHLVGRRHQGIEVDERDLRLRHRADRAGDWALTLIVVAGVVVLASVPQARLAWWLAPIVLANLLIGLLIAKSLVEHVALAGAYRTGRA